MFSWPAWFFDSPFASRFPTVLTRKMDPVQRNCWLLCRCANVPLHPETRALSLRCLWDFIFARVCALQRIPGETYSIFFVKILAHMSAEAEELIYFEWRFSSPRLRVCRRYRESQLSDFLSISPWFCAEGEGSVNWFLKWIRNSSLAQSESDRVRLLCDAQSLKQLLTLWVRFLHWFLCYA